MRRLLLPAVWLLLVGATSSGHAAPGECPPGDAVLTQRLAELQTLSANFEQRVTAADGHPLQQSSGVLQLAKPGRIYWVAEPPFEQTVVSDGERIWVYDPDLEQVTIHNLDDRVQSTPALLLSGEVDNLEDTYRVSGRQIGDNTREFTLEPRSPDSLFTSLRLTFFKGELQEMRMQDSLAQLSGLSFDRIRLNEPVEAGAFTLDYPEGVDIIRDGA